MTFWRATFETIVSTVIRSDTIDECQHQLQNWFLSTNFSSQKRLPPKMVKNFCKKTNKIINIICYSKLVYLTFLKLNCLTQNIEWKAEQLSECFNLFWDWVKTRSKVVVHRLTMLAHTHLNCLSLCGFPDFGGRKKKSFVVFLPFWGKRGFFASALFFSFFIVCWRWISTNTKMRGILLQREQWTKRS